MGCIFSATEEYAIEMKTASLGKQAVLSDGK